MNHIADMRISFDDIDEKVSQFVTWQDSFDGRKANLPRIEDSKKEISFIEWDIRLKNAEREICRAKYIATNIVANLSQNLIVANIIDKCPPSTLPLVKD